MSGGRLVVLDRSGRAVKRYSLATGLATLGSAQHCDIRVMLPSVCAHHATIVVHATQTVVRNVGSGETLVNGVPVSVAALRHGDQLSLGGRSLRWEYCGSPPRLPSPAAALVVNRRPRSAPRRHTASAPQTPRSPALQLALELRHRASHPGNTGGKQVAVVQPQRRDTSEQNDKNEDVANTRRSTWANAGQPPSTKASQWIESRKPHTPAPHTQSSKPNTPRVATPKPNTPRVATPKSNTPRVATPKPNTPRVATPKPNTPRVATLKTNTPKVATPKPNTPRVATPKTNTPKVATPKVATPRMATPRMATPKVAYSKVATPKVATPKTSPRLATPRSVDPKPSSIKIPVPSPYPRRTNTPKNSTPRFTPKPKRSPPKSAPGGTARARSPLRIGALKNARRHRLTKIQDPPGIDHMKQAAIMLMTGHTPKARLSLSKQGSARKPGSSGSLIVKKTSPRPRSMASYTPRNSRGSTRNVSAIAIDESEPESSLTTDSQPRKSALRGRSSVRKHDSIRFDLSNLGLESSDTDISLHYSETSTLTMPNSPTLSPSSRRSIHSRSSRILQKSIRTPIEESIKSNRTTVTPSPPSKSRRSSRGTFIVQQALDSNTSWTIKGLNVRNSSKRSSKSMSDSQTTVGSAFRTKTLSPSPKNLETYSIVDLVSVDSERSVYDSAGSVETSFGTPRDGRSSRRTRSTIDLGMAESSTPYVAKTRKSRSVSSRGSKSSSMKTAYQSDVSAASVASQSPKRSKSLSGTTQQHISVDTTKVSRSSRSRSQVDDSELLLISDNSQDISLNSDKSQKSKRMSSRNVTVENQEGMSTPENRQSPEEAGTPVLSIQSLLDSSLSRSVRKHSKRKTIGALRSGPKPQDRGGRSKSLNFTARRGLLRLSDDSPKSGEKTVTPKSAAKPEQEAVKNKHSTAKKPQSKRAIIDEIGDGDDIVRQLFNSPVKRKLSQSMTEFSRSLLDDEAMARRPTRNTVVLTGRTLDNSLLENTEAFTPERFVSPLTTPNDSPNLSGVKRIFKKTTPENDLRNVKGLKRLMRTPRPRRSIANDLTDVAGVKRVFARSPENRLSDVNVKAMFAAGPQNDLRRVSGVKRALERNSPRNDLSDVRGVKRMFGRGQRDEYEDVRGVKRMFGRGPNNDYGDVSGVEELFDLSVDSARDDSAFDRLVGKPTIKNVYSKSLVRSVNRLKTKRGKTLHASIDAITANVEEWLDKELEKRLQSEKRKTGNREVENLATDTVQGRSESHLPIKKRSSANAMLPLNSSRRSVNSSKSGSTASLRRSVVKPSSDASLRTSAGLTRKSVIVKQPVSPLSSSLPLKKRPLVHSTPLKGRAKFLAPPRTSPIPPIVSDGPADKPEEVQPALPKPKATARATRKTRHNAETPQPSPKLSPKPPTMVIPKPSPVFKPAPRTRRAIENAKKGKELPKTAQKPSKKVQPAKKVTDSPKQDKQSPKKTRARKQAESEPPISPKRTRKQAEKAPKETKEPKTTRNQKKETEPPKSPKTRGRKDTKVATPKAKTPRKTRARVQRGTVVVTKPSPQLKPKKATESNARRSRKTAASEVMVEAKRRKLESPKQSPKKTRATKKVSDKPEPKVTKSKAKPKPEPQVVEIPTRSRRKVEIVEPVESVRKPKASAQNKKVAVKVASPKNAVQAGNTRKRKAEVIAPKEDKVASTRKGGKVEVASTRTRKVEEAPAKQLPTRKRKAAAEEVVPRKAAKNTVEERSPREKRSTTKAAEKSAPSKETRATRARATTSGAPKTNKPAPAIKPSGRSRRR